MSDLQVVLGEMQPWTDRTDHRPALTALLADALPTDHRTLMVGPHSRSLISLVLERTSDATILVRSVSDAEDLSAEYGDRLHVIAGALDGLRSERYDVIVAADGLDRVLGYDSADLSWSERLDALTALAAPDAVVVLAVENEFSLVNLLDSRPPDERHGDDEWRPLHDDPTRPVSVDQLTAALPWSAQLYADFGARAYIAAGVAAESRPGELPTRLATEALESLDTPLLSPVSDGINTAARAGLLPAISTGWLAICGMHPEQDLYTQSATQVLTATKTKDTWQTTLTPAPSTTSAADAVPPPDSPPPDSPASGNPATGAALSSELSFHPSGLMFDPAVVAEEVPAGVSVESVLIRLAAAEDVPAFRKLAARLGEWVTESRVVLRWDDVVLDGDSFAYGVSPWVTETASSTTDLLAAAWYRFHDRLITAHRRHPWPPWMIGDDLVATWMGMSGIQPPEPTQATSPSTPSASTEYVARGKELAHALAEALQTPVHPAIDVRSALTEADQAKQELFELKGHVYGLERTLGFRNKAMKTRENRIRELRSQLDRLKADHNRIRGSRTYAVSRVIFQAAQVRKPHVVARKVTRRLRKR
ncbi:hypothetical protein [Kribbella sp. NPDC055071]